jgi:hypothetical protein
MSKRKWSDEQLIDAIKTSHTIAEVIRKLNLTKTNYNTIKNYIKH